MSVFALATTTLCSARNFAFASTPEPSSCQMNTRCVEPFATFRHTHEIEDNRSLPPTPPTALKTFTPINSELGGPNQPEYGGASY